MNVISINLKSKQMTPSVANAILINARISSKLGESGPTLGSGDDAPTIEYSSTSNTYLMIESTMVTELSRSEAIEHLLSLGGN